MAITIHLTIPLKKQQLSTLSSLLLLVAEFREVSVSSSTLLTLNSKLCTRTIGMVK